MNHDILVINLFNEILVCSHIDQTDIGRAVWHSVRLVWFGTETGASSIRFEN